MAFSDDLTTIEDRLFSAELNVVSSTRAFFGAISRNPVVLRVLREIRESGELLEDLLGHALELCEIVPDSRYENPYDTALATYLWLTHFSSEGISRSLAESIDGTSRTWYAKKLAYRILFQKQMLLSGTWPSTQGQIRENISASEQQINMVLDRSWPRLINKAEIAVQLAK